ncbi:MAG: phospholipase D-like domain-containing protein [Candidatus Bipolaricaulota bacterium]|nr:phospholipase D-like domain-containing protein [Candidatus Bipolaricaulota bacterium]
MGKIIAFVVFFLYVWGGVIAQTLVLPVIDRPGKSVYYNCAREAFAEAERSIDLLLSVARLEDNPLWDELLAATARGIKVRVILDESDWAPGITEKNRVTINFLHENAIEARFDSPGTTTHAKLVIVDRRLVILGSSNWNYHSLNDQEQSNMWISDAQVGAAFATYFDRLWAAELPPGGVSLECPPLVLEEPLLIAIPETSETANYAAVLLDLLDTAEHSIHVVMYRISHYPNYQQSLANEILTSLIAAAGRGVDVKVLTDDCSFYPASAEANLEAALYLHLHGIEVRLDDPGMTTHAKLVVVDQRSVLLGSTNWNYYSLEKNNEVDIALLNLPRIADHYERFFQSVWKEGIPVAD